jgi:hypothetical protein
MHCTLLTIINLFCRPTSAPSCDALNNETYTDTGITENLKIGFVGLMQGSSAMYSEGYCQAMTVSMRLLLLLALAQYLIRMTDKRPAYAHMCMCAL